MNRKTKPFCHSSEYYRQLSKISKNNSETDLSVMDSSRHVCPSYSSDHHDFNSESSSSANDNTEINNSKHPEFHSEIQSEHSASHDEIHSEYSESHDEIFSEDSETEENENNRFVFKDKLQQWALQYQIPHNALNGLLGILREDQKYFVPKDARSLLQTPRINNIQAFSSGQYWYNGIEKSLNDVFCSQPSEELPSEISLTFNMDGLPLAKSAKKEFWPILCKINGVKNAHVLVVAIYYGETKPPVEDFLRPFVNELQNLLNVGLIINKHRIAVKIRCFVCDTPARCFIKGTVGFNSYHGCMKCTVIGEFDRRGRHMSFPRTDMALRTDHSFRNRLDSDHHNNRIEPFFDIVFCPPN